MLAGEAEKRPEGGYRRFSAVEAELELAQVNRHVPRANP